MSLPITSLVRTNIQNIKPYASARSEFSGNASIFLDANENSLGSPITKDYSRYPDPMQWELKKAIAQVKGVHIENQFIGNGSDEIIDILIRVFCEPYKDNFLVFPPTFDLYEIWGKINAVEARKVSLLPDFQLDMENIPKAIDTNTKIIFLCSPNNPTGNCLHREDIEFILNNFEGIVVVDEAYINFATQHSFIKELEEYPNLIVLQTLSKAWGLAGLRVGIAFASQEIIHYLNIVKPPYNMSDAAIQLGIEAMAQVDVVNQRIAQLVSYRKQLEEALLPLKIVQKIFPSDANFILIKFEEADRVYRMLLERGIVVRSRSQVPLCENTLRITVGTKKENQQLVQALSEINTLI